MTAQPCPNGCVGAVAWPEVVLDDEQNVMFMYECSHCQAHTKAYYDDDKALADWNAGKVVSKE